MSLDIVLAVAGAAHDHPWMMVFGLVLSIALVGITATFIARMLNRYRWTGYVGLVLYVAKHMVWDGYRSIVVRQGYIADPNAATPFDFLDISAEEKAKHPKNVKDLRPIPVEIAPEVTGVQPQNAAPAKK